MVMKNSDVNDVAHTISAYEMRITEKLLKELINETKNKVIK